mgnify:FL=1
MSVDATHEHKIQKRELNTRHTQATDETLLSLYDEHKSFLKVSAILGGSDLGWSKDVVRNRIHRLKQFKIDDEVHEANDIFLQLLKGKSLPPEVLAKHSRILWEYGYEIQLLTECVVRLT